jgi:hypothetical protein
MSLVPKRLNFVKRKETPNIEEYKIPPKMGLSLNFIIILLSLVIANKFLFKHVIIMISYKNNI